VFGRGGEERLACEEAGIPVEVVPGVTSAIAVPAAAGIPVTHRGVARGFSVLTGHESVGDFPTDRSHTLVLLMGVSRLRETAAEFIAAGHDPETPVAVIESGWSDQQRVTVGTLATIADAAESAGARPPAVTVVGDVVTLSPHWA
jgi:uroporphyrin-III C-methyltransferase/precorrin-2 dehydrogenase/sirohydrochlorin ferrochelatase